MAKKQNPAEHYAVKAQAARERRLAAEQNENHHNAPSKDALRFRIARFLKKHPELKELVELKISGDHIEYRYLFGATPGVRIKLEELFAKTDFRREPDVPGFDEEDAHIYPDAEATMSGTTYVGDEPVATEQDVAYVAEPDATPAPVTAQEQPMNYEDRESEAAPTRESVKAKIVRLQAEIAAQREILKSLKGTRAPRQPGAPRAPREGTKAMLLEQHLREGIGLTEAKELMGWAHTQAVRAASYALAKKLGLQIKTIKREGKDALLQLQEAA